MTRPMLHLMALAFAACLFAGLPAEASSITSTDNPLCRYSITGVIESGDLEKIKAIAVQGKLFNADLAEAEIMGDNAAAICLDSPGGSFVEGIAIAKFFSEKGVATVIDEGATCASACAIMFMAGRTHGVEEDYTNRKLHANGSLGFHRPSLTLIEAPNKSYTAKELNDSADFVVSAVTYLLSLGNEQGSFDLDRRMKPSLIEGMLRTGADDLLMVDTVDEIGRWGIDVIGTKSPHKFTNANLYNACANFIAWNIDQSNTDEYTAINSSLGEASVKKLDPSKRPAIDGLISSYIVTPGKSGYLSAMCVVNVYKSRETGDPYLRLCAQDDYIGITYGKCFENTEAYDSWVSPLAIHSPSTTLQSLNASDQ